MCRATLPIPALISATVSLAWMSVASIMWLMLDGVHRRYCPIATDGSNEFLTIFSYMLSLYTIVCLFSLLECGHCMSFESLTLYLVRIRMWYLRVLSMDTYRNSPNTYPFHVKPFLYVKNADKDDTRYRNTLSVVSFYLADICSSYVVCATKPWLYDFCHSCVLLSDNYFRWWLTSVPICIGTW